MARTPPMHARSSDHPQDVLEFGPFQLLPDGRVLREGVPLLLAPKERAVLRVLAESAGELLPKSTLLRRVWGDEPVGDESLTRSIHHVRARLGPREDGGEYIETGHRVGYRLAVPVSRRTRDARLLVRLHPTTAAALPAFEGETLVEEVIAALLRRPVRGVSVLGTETALRSRGDADDAAAAQAVGSELVATLALEQVAERRFVVCHVTRPGATTRDTTVGTARVPVAARPDAAHADAIADAMLRVVSPGASSAVSGRLTSALRTEPRVFEAWLEGRGHFRHRSADRMRLAIDLFRTALAWDPEYTPAMIGLAEVYLTLVSWTALSVDDAVSFTAPLLARAEHLDPATRGLLTQRAAMTSGADWRFAEAEGMFRRALQQDHADTNAYLFYGRHLLNAGLPDAAAMTLTTCRELDPLSSAPHVLQAYALFCDGQQHEAVEAIDRACMLDPTSGMACAVAAMLAAWDGRHGDALAHAARVEALGTRLPVVLSMLADVYARTGHPDRALVCLAPLREGAPGLGVSMMAPAALACGDVSMAIACLERALETRCVWLPTMRQDPRLRALHGHPGFEAVFASVPRIDNLGTVGA